MADNDKKVSYEVDANPSGFEAGLQRGADALRGFSANAEGNFKKVQDSLGAVMKQLTVLAGIVAGGAFFKDAIAASNELTAESTKLQKALGITGERADTLRTALADIGSDSDAYIGAFQKFARQVKTNEDAVTSYGLKTRDSNGNLRDSNELFTEALQVVGRYKPGLDQNIVAMALFGKSIDEVMKLQKLNNEVTAEAKKKNEELGLTVSKDNVAASKAYKLAMNDVGDVMTAVKKVIGDAVMPVFTELGRYFASTGPYVVEVFKGAMMGLLAAFEVVRGAVKTIAGVVFEAFSLIVEGAGMIGDVFSKLFKGDFSGAYESAKQLGARVGQAFAGSFANFVAAGNEVGDAIDGHARRLYGSGGGSPDKPKGSDDGKHVGQGDGKDKSSVSQWDAELAEAKLAFQEQQNLAGAFYTFGKQRELAFWKDKLAMTIAGSADNTAVRKKVAELQLSIGADAFARELAGLQAREAAFKANTAARLSILDQEAAIVRQRFGAESKEYEEVQKKIVEAKRQAIEQQKQIDMLRTESVRNAQLAELETVRQQALLARDLRVLSNADVLQLEQQLEDRRYQIQAQALRDRLELAKADPDRNPVEVARINAELEQAELEHQRRAGEIRAQTVKESAKFASGAYDSIQSGWAQTIAKFAQGQLTIAGFFRSMWQGVVQATIGAFAQMAAEWLAKMVLARVLGKATATSEINANAGVAGSAAVASTAAIPVIGPGLAPAAGAAAYTAALAYGASLASAEGGFDIPAAVNPIVQTHAKEMILPAKYADVIRGLAEGAGGGLGGRGGSDTTPAQINVTRLAGDFFMIHRAELAKAINSARRDYVLR